jgi:hypothetical protein
LCCAILLILRHISRAAPYCSSCTILLILRHISRAAPYCSCWVSGFFLMNCIEDHLT